MIMKNTFLKVCLLITLSVIYASCRKYGRDNGPIPSASGRILRFVLYTDEDFSEDSSVIHFTLFIKRGSAYVYDTIASNLLFDSAFAPMQIKEIPDAAHKIVVEKKVLDEDDTLLTAGFIYQIENVGSSWHIDTSKAGNPLKVIEYNFR
jgi:hypothetical protein